MECHSYSTTVLDSRPHIVSNVIDQVDAAFFYGDYTQQMQSLPEETLFGHFVITLNNVLKMSLHRRMKVMRVGVKASTSSPLSAEHGESTMSQPWRNYPLILQTLVNPQPHQSIMKNTHL